MDTKKNKFNNRHFEQDISSLISIHLNQLCTRAEVLTTQLNDLHQTLSELEIEIKTLLEKITAFRNFRIGMRDSSAESDEQEDLWLSQHHQKSRLVREIRARVLEFSEQLGTLNIQILATRDMLRTETTILAVSDQLEERKPTFRCA